MSRRPGRDLAPLLVVGGIASVQVGAAVARTLFDDLGAAGVTLLRLAIAALVLLLVTRPAVRRWTRRQWGAAIVLGTVLGAMNLIFYLSLRTVPLGVAVTVEFIGPLGVALVQTRRWLDLGWAVLAAAGVVLLCGDPPGEATLGGLGLAALAGLCWACYILATARVGKELPGVDGLGVAMAIGMLVALPFGLEGASTVLERPALLLPALLVAMMSSVLPYAFEMHALRTLPTRVFGILMSLEPAAAAVAGLVVLGQALGGRELVALVMVSIASAGVTLAQRREPGVAREPEPEPAPPA